MKIQPSRIPRVTLLSPTRFDDARGSFRPIFAQRLHAESGIQHSWDEMNLSHTKENCIRGLHLQSPNGQAKLITVISGEIFDVAVALRPGDGFGKWESFHLSAEDPAHPSQIYLPAGIAHGIATPAGPATIAYLVDQCWDPESEHVLAFDDPTLAIPWPVTAPELSERDREGRPLEFFQSL